MRSLSGGEKMWRRIKTDNLKKYQPLAWLRQPPVWEQSFWGQLGERPFVKDPP